MFKVKRKYNITLFWWFYCWLSPQSAYLYSVSASNFEQVFVIRVRETSHNVLEKQKAIYLYRNKSWKTYFIQWFINAPNWNQLLIYDNISALNLLQKWQAYFRFSHYLMCYIHREFFFFWLYQAKSLLKSLKQWNKLVGI